jgi:hypothetical protein
MGEEMGDWPDELISLFWLTKKRINRVRKNRGEREPS